MHPKEFKKVKNNTGFMTHLSLSNSHLFVGIDFTNHKEVNAIIATYSSYVLFPSDRAINLSKEAMPYSGKANALFIIDSTWSCAKSIFRASKNLQELPHVSFTTLRNSQYQIKAQPKNNYLSTIESVQVVLELLSSTKQETLKKEQTEGFLQPFFSMIRYQKEQIANPKSRAVRFKKTTKAQQ